MQPLRITAELRNAIALPGGPLALDALLMAAVCLRDNIPPILDGSPQEIPIPVALSDCGRVHLASSSVAAVEAFERTWINRRHPIEETQLMGSRKIRRLSISAGPAKSYRLPLERGHLDHDRLDWFCVGDREGIVALLSLVHYLGKKRSTGNGAVERWTVAPHEGWDGFPVVRDGKPLRPLPVDWPGLIAPEVQYAGMRPPYWHASTRALCAVPEVG